MRGPFNPLKRSAEAARASKMIDDNRSKRSLIKTSYGRYTVTYSRAAIMNCAGVCNGPVIVESDVPIMTTQRIVGWSSFEETLGVAWT